MISWGTLFLVIALVASAVGFSGIAGTAVNIAWIVAVVGFTISVVYTLRNLHPRQR